MSVSRSRAGTLRSHRPNRDSPSTMLFWVLGVVGDARFSPSVTWIISSILCLSARLKLGGLQQPSTSSRTLETTPGVVVPSYAKLYPLALARNLDPRRQAARHLPSIGCHHPRATPPPRSLSLSLSLSVARHPALKRLLTGVRVLLPERLDLDADALRKWYSQKCVCAFFFFFFLREKKGCSRRVEAGKHSGDHPNRGGDPSSRGVRTGIRATPSWSPTRERERLYQHDHRPRRRRRAAGGGWRHRNQHPRG